VAASLRQVHAVRPATDPNNVRLDITLAIRSALCGPEIHAPGFVLH
jgi:hypothetical protein